ncbi:MAG: hypothetical protein LAP40_02810 [Acidobacteriia bacterium]|nr:hypothetical protein [Terriglobia bacterium]
MAAKDWWIGCGALAAVGVGAVVLGGFYFAGRAGEVSQGIQHAQDRYADSNREFPFTPPAAGKLSPERFSRYLKVREAVDTAMAPVKSGEGIVSFLSALTGLPEQVSRAHVDALREQSMSIDEYRWISRQVYTTVAGEPYRPDADPEIREVQRSFEAAFRRRNGLQVQANGRGVFDAGLIDFTWLKVPEATRAIVREHARAIANLPNAVLADTVLLSLRGSRQ